MLRKLTLLLLFIATSLASNDLENDLTPIHEKGRCSMYDQIRAPFISNTPARDISNNSAFQQDILDICYDSGVELLSLNGGNKVCCSATQLSSLKSNIGVAYSILGSCPACWRNFVGFWCRFTCSSDQSLFLQVTSHSDTSNTTVDNLDFYVSDRFATGLFESCKDMKLSAANMLALQFVAPGAKTGWDMLRFMGKKSPLNPIDIRFPGLERSLPSANMSRLDPVVFGCNDAVNGCTCIDCEKSCSADLPLAFHRNFCKIGSKFECVAFISTLIYGLIILGIVCYSVGLSVWKRQKRRRSPMPAVFLADVDRSLDNYENEAFLGRKNSLLYTPAPYSLINETSDIRHRKVWFIDAFLQKCFYQLGMLCARNLRIVLAIAALLVFISSFGWLWFSVETEPINLWVGKSSVALAEKNFFDQNFGPFYRISQLIIASESKSVLRRDFLDQAWKLQSVVENINVKTSSDLSVGLSALCFKPMGSACATQSFRGWYQDDYAQFTRDVDFSRMKECFEKPGVSSCFSRASQPLEPKLIFGDLPKDGKIQFGENVKALVITFVLKSFTDSKLNEPAIAWEKEVVKILKEIQSNPSSHNLNLPADFRIAFSAESSVEEELSRESSADIPTVIISYLVMFLYASLALGKIRFSKCLTREAFLTTRFLLGVGGIVIVIASVTSSIGVLSFLGQRATLIIAEVIPFLVLAVGVDNIFIIVNTFDRITRMQKRTWASKLSSNGLDTIDDEDEGVEVINDLPIDERIAMTMGQIGPSLFLSSISETLAFGLGTLVSMPAVSIFSLYASLAVFLNFLLQITCFVCFLTLDAKRQETRRMDCCLFPVGGSGYSSIDTDDHLQTFTHTTSHEPQSYGSYIEYFFGEYFSSFILHRWVKPLIMLIFATGFVFMGLWNVQQVPLGLDQRLALPRDSYLIKYFDYLETYLEIGPPLYIVVKGKPPGQHGKNGLDMFSLEDQRRVCGKYVDCHSYSVANTLNLEYERTKSISEMSSSIVATPSANWFDDFVAFMNNLGRPCCIPSGQIRSCFIDQSNLPEDDELPDYEDPDMSNHNTACGCHRWRDFVYKNHPGHYPPIGNFLGNPLDSALPKNTTKLLESMKIWLKSLPYTSCPTAGGPAYGNSIAFGKSEQTGQEYIKAFYIRTYHNVLRTQQDFIDAYEKARHLTTFIQKELGLEGEDQNDTNPVFPYSIFYVFFEQYLTIKSVCATIVGLAMLAIFILVTVLLGSPLVALAIVLTVTMMVVDLIGVMYLWNISLNAVSTVNIVIAVGIGVEFCVHIARGTILMGSVSRSLAELGSSVFSGITLTKILGIGILAFAKSSIFEVFYFRMYLCIVLLGAAHGLILLPVLLDYLCRAKLFGRKLI